MTVDAQESTASASSESPRLKLLNLQKNGRSMGRDDEKLCCDSSLKSVDKNGDDKNSQYHMKNFSSSLNVDSSLSPLDNPYPPSPLHLAYMDGKECENEEFENKEDSHFEFPNRLLLLKSENKFPWLSETESLEYKKYSRMCFDAMSIGPLIFLITVFYCCHANFQYALVDGPFFIAGLVFGLIASYQYYALFLLGHTVRRFNLCDSSKSFIRSFELFFVFSSNFEDSIAIMATISASSYLYARVLNGQCAPDTTLWGSQRCNPVALSHSVPMDHMLYVSFFPLMHQLILRGISIHGVFACWVISTVFIIATVVHAEAWLELWSVYASLFILCTAFEHERFCRVCFFQSKRVKADDSRNIKRMVSQQKMEQDLAVKNLLIERNNHEKEIQAIRTEEERKRMAFEHDQLVSLIGNVAHDLKTPLQSVGIDLESLKAKLTSVNDILMRWFNSRQVVEFKNTDQEMRGSDILSLIDGVREGVTSVDYSCTFMKSAINRSLDFTKTAKNIVLTPSVSPFHIAETLNWPLKCVMSMQSDVTVTMAPIDPELSGIVISDKHWLIENALCLLSNAVKYSSEGGTAHLITELIRVSMQKDEVVTLLPRVLSNMQMAHSGEGMDPHTFSEEFFAQTQAMNHARKPRAPELAGNEGQLMIRIIVEDTGIGIPDDVKRGLFQPYAQAQRFAGGTGLGLYSLAKRIDALGGKYGVRDRDDGQSGMSARDMITHYSSRSFMCFQSCLF